MCSPPYSFTTCIGLDGFLTQLKSGFLTAERLAFTCTYYSCLSEALHLMGLSWFRTRLTCNKAA